MINRALLKFNEGEEQFAAWYDALTKEEKQCIDAEIKSETDIIHTLIRLIKNKTMLKIVGVQWA